MFVASLVALSLAAVPPMSADDLHESAEFVAVGTVVSVSSTDVKVEDGTDHEFTAEIRIDRIEKGIVPSTPPKKKKSKKEIVTVHFRRTGQRPPGWAGPQGQNSVFQKGDRIRVFARTQDGQWRLLEPNGWEPAPTDTKRE